MERTTHDRTGTAAHSAICAFWTEAPHPTLQLDWLRWEGPPVRHRCLVD